MMAPKKKKRLIEAEDICRLSLINEVALSPDQSKIAYSIEKVSDDKQKYYAHLFVYDQKQKRRTQYTFGEIHDHGLVWSPDGESIAFVSSRNKKTGIYIMPASGGAERLVVEKDGSFSGLQWTPDGAEIVYQFNYNDSHFVKDEKKKKEAPVCRHITRLYYRLDGAGWRPQDHSHIWKVEIESGKCKQLTKGKYDDMMPAVAPDGKTVVFVSNHSANPDLDNMREDLFKVSINGGKVTKIPTPAGPVSSPSFSPDGKKIAFLGHDNPKGAWGITNFHVWAVGLSGRPVAKNLIPKFDRQCYDETIGDMGEGFSTPQPEWSPDGKKIYFTASDTGSTHIFCVPSKGGTPTRITHRKSHIKDYSVNGKKSQIAAVIADLKTPGELCLFPAVYKGDQKAAMLDAPSRSVLTKVNMPRVREIWFKAYDGTDLQGWLVTPPNFNKKRTYPGILEIHGGPVTQYGFTFYHEMLYLASKGYVVFYTNPRGGAGRGTTWSESIIGDWGSIDYQDCMAATDYLEKLSYVNSKRIGVTGGSYGGYMTNWMIGKTNRFRAAVTQRSVVDLKSFVGSSDFGFDIYREFGGQPWQVPETYQRCSPLTYARKIKTPLLIIHSEQDLRCGIEQAEQLFATLKLMRKTVEMVRFPEEPHGLSRHGRPDRRLARLEWIVRWFDKYMK